MWYKFRSEEIYRENKAYRKKLTEVAVTGRGQWRGRSKGFGISRTGLRGRRGLLCRDLGGTKCRITKPRSCLAVSQEINSPDSPCFLRGRSLRVWALGGYWHPDSEGPWRPGKHGGKLLGCMSVVQTEAIWTWELSFSLELQIKQPLLAFLFLSSTIKLDYQSWRCLGLQMAKFKIFLPRGLHLQVIFIVSNKSDK